MYVFMYVCMSVCIMNLCIYAHMYKYIWKRKFTLKYGEHAERMTLWALMNWPSALRVTSTRDSSSSWGSTLWNFYTPSPPTTFLNKLERLPEKKFLLRCSVACECGSRAKPYSKTLDRQEKNSGANGLAYFASASATEALNVSWGGDQVVEDGEEGGPVVVPLETELLITPHRSNVCLPE
jgi:hypothetical protein